MKESPFQDVWDAQDAHSGFMSTVMAVLVFVVIGIFILFHNHQKNQKKEEVKIEQIIIKDQNNE